MLSPFLSIQSYQYEPGYVHFVGAAIFVRGHSTIPVRVIAKPVRTLAVASRIPVYTQAGDGKSPMGELPAFFAGELAAVNQTLYRAKNQGIHQCEHWFMHSPPGCADMVQLPLNKTETAHPDG